MNRCFLSLPLLLVCVLVSTGKTRAEDPADVSIRVGTGKIDFLAGKELVSTCLVESDVAKPYLWPLIGPGGVPLSRAWPMKENEPGETKDHPHQKSAWFCHGDVIPEGIALKDRIKGVEGVDFWSENQGHGKIVCSKVDGVKTAKNHGQVTLHNEWQTAEGTRVLDETRVIHLYNFGETNLFIFEIDLSAIVCPITFGDTKEGSFGIRINDSITEKSGKGKLENADGKVTEKECWGQQSKWCDYSGPIKDRVVGLAILDDPRNKYPACWHSRAYGLMAANPFGRAVSGFPAVKDLKEPARIAKGEHLHLRYGLLLHPGDAREGKVADYFDRFVKYRE